MHAPADPTDSLLSDQDFRELVRLLGEAVAAKGETPASS